MRGIPRKITGTYIMSNCTNVQKNVQLSIWEGGQRLPLSTSGETVRKNLQICRETPARLSVHTLRRVVKMYVKMYKCT